MPSAPSSISSSRPGLGALGACLLLAAAEFSARASGLAPAPLPVDVRVFHGTRPPDVLLVGDSRTGRVDFDAFAKTYAPGNDRVNGMVWSMPAGSATAMLESLAAMDVTPRTLVVELNICDALTERFLDDARARLETSRFLEVRTDRLRAFLAGTLAAFPRECGPSALGHWAAGLRKHPAPGGPPAWEEPPMACADPLEAKALTLKSYRAYVAAEPRPSARAIEAAVAALKTLKARGARLVLVRLPVSSEMLALEDDWGSREALDRIATEVGTPLVDLNTLPCGASLREAVVDGSHVRGEGPRRRLSAELGRIARQ